MELIRKVCAICPGQSATTKYIYSQATAKAFFIKRERMHGEKDVNVLQFPTENRTFSYKSEKQFTTTWQTSWSHCLSETFTASYWDKAMSFDNLDVPVILWFCDRTWLPSK